MNLEYNLENFKIMYESDFKDKDNEEKDFLLYQYCGGPNCNPEIIDFLCKNGANANSMHNLGDSTPLSLALNWGNIDIIKVLLKYGANPNLLSRDAITNEQNRTIFYYDCYKLDAVKYILNYCSIETVKKSIDDMSNQPYDFLRISQEKVVMLLQEYLNYIDKVNEQNNNENMNKNIETLQPFIKEKFVVLKILQMKYEMEYYDFK